MSVIPSKAALVLLGAAAIAAHGAAQQPPPLPGDTTAAAMAPPQPTPEQQRYLKGLRTASRGVAQIKDGMARLSRAQGIRDTALVRQAAKRLGGLCAAAHGFLASGRTQMEPAVYPLPTRQPARDLSFQVDSLAAATKSCEKTAGKSPVSVTAELTGRLRAYEAAVAAFRTATGLPNTVSK